MDILAQNSQDSQSSFTATANDFDIRNFVQYLEPSPKGETNKYVCPVCDGHNLSVSSDSPQYDCYQCHDTPEIARTCLLRSGINSETDFRKSNKNNVIGFGKKKKQKEFLTLPELIWKDGSLARLPELKNLPDIKEGKENTVTTVYRYSESEKEIKTRFDFLDKLGNPDKKFIYPKGSQPSGWLPYQYEDIKEFSKDSYVLLVEGEKCVEIARQLGLVATTVCSWSKNWKFYFEAFSQAQIKGIVMFPDNDKAGIIKAESLVKAYCDLKPNFDVLILDPPDIWDKMPEKGDIAVWLEETNMSANEYIQKLEEELHLKFLSREFEETLLDLLGLRASIEKEETKNTYYRDRYSPALGYHFFDLVFKDRWKVFNEVFFKANEEKQIWEPVDTKAVKNLVDTELEKFWITRDKVDVYHTFNDTQSIKEVIDYAAIRAYDTRAKNSYIAFKDCVFDVETGQILKPSLVYNIDFRIEHNLELTDECPATFNKFLSQATETDCLPVLRAYIRKCLDEGMKKAQYFLYLVGDSGSGKGTLIKLLQSFFPDYKVSEAKLPDFANPDKRHQKLKTAQLVTMSDYSGRLDEGFDEFLMLAEGAKLDARKLHSSDNYTLDNYFCFIIASAMGVSMQSTATGWERRAITIPFKKKGRKKGDVDLDLLDKLKKEAGQIIGWALNLPREEAIDILKRANTEVESIKFATNEQANQNDPVKAFIDCCLRPARTVVEISTYEEVMKARNTDGTAWRQEELFKAFLGFLVARGHSPNWTEKTFATTLARALPNHYIKSDKRIRKPKSVDPDRGYLDIRFTNIRLALKAFSNVGQKDTKYWTCSQEELFGEGGLEEFNEVEQNWNILINPEPEQPITENNNQEFSVNQDKTLFISVPENRGEVIETYRVIEETTTEYEVITREGEERTITKSKDIVTYTDHEERELFFPKVGNWIEIKPYNRLERKEGRPTIVKVTHIFPYNFEYYTKEEKPGYHDRGWRVLSKNERIEQGLTFSVN